MYFLNPTLIPYNNSFYLLVRKETDIQIGKILSRGMNYILRIITFRPLIKKIVYLNMSLFILKYQEVNGRKMRSI